MKKIFTILALILLMCSCTQEKKHVLVLTERGGWHAEFTAAATKWIVEEGDRQGFDVVEIHNTDPITKDFLAGFDAIIQLDYVTYTWTDTQKHAFIDYIDNGKGGWVGFHHASLLNDFDGFQNWEWFSDFLGHIHYENYIAELSDGTVSVEAAEHPVMKGVNPSFIIQDDEWYIYDKSPRLDPAIKVLASVDEGTYTADTQIKMGDHPVVWTNTKKAARNVYFQFGHSPKLINDNPDFLKMFSNAIAYALGKNEAPKLTKHGDADEKMLIAYVFMPQEMPDATYLTHINYAFGHVNETFDGVYIPDPKQFHEVADLKKKYPHLKVVLSIGGWGSGRFSEMVSDPACRASFAKDCKRVMDEYGIDGIDIDWEYPTQDIAGISAAPTDTDNYTLMMKDIREAIGPDAILSQATCGFGRFIDFKNVDQYMSYTNVMSYDLGWVPYHNSPLFPSKFADPSQLSVSECIDAHLAAGISPEKLVIGLPFYGHGEKDFPRGVDVTKAHLLPGYTYHWDEEGQVPYLTNDKTGEFAFGYENEKSLAIKAQYAIDKGLRGAMYWSYNGDNKSGDLRRTVYQVLNGIDPRLGLK